MTQPPVADARRIEVDPARIARWVDGFAGRHGALVWAADGEDLALTAADGASARLSALAAAVPVPPSPEGLERWAAGPARVALVLVRRGGYAVGLAEGERLLAHKAGTRYVQSRTAAGGWSQQRYARRRGNQADALVEAVADHVGRLLAGRPRPGGARPDAGPGALVVGGDRTLVRDVLAEPALAPLRALARRELYDLPDPRLSVLEQALRRGRAVRVLLTEPVPG